LVELDLGRLDVCTRKGLTVAAEHVGYVIYLLAQFWRQISNAAAEIPTH
jgi:hypothetical protein